MDVGWVLCGSGVRSGSLPASLSLTEVASTNGQVKAATATYTWDAVQLDGTTTNQ